MTDGRLGGFGHCLPVLTKWENGKIRGIDGEYFVWACEDAFCSSPVFLFLSWEKSLVSRIEDWE